jgi:hypothetical protein
MRQRHRPYPDSRHPVAQGERAGRCFERRMAVRGFDDILLMGALARAPVRGKVNFGAQPNLRHAPERRRSLWNPRKVQSDAFSRRIRRRSFARHRGADMCCRTMTPGRESPLESPFIFSSERRQADDGACSDGTPFALPHRCWGKSLRPGSIHISRTFGARTSRCGRSSRHARDRAASGRLSRTSLSGPATEGLPNRSPQAIDSRRYASCAVRSGSVQEARSR